MKPLFPLALSAAIAFCSAGHAETAKTEGQKTAEMTFASIDSGGKGYAHMGDLEIYRQSVFLGMDANEDGKVTYPEFAAWDPGFGYVAELEGRPEAYTTATKIVFAFWDRNGDGEMNQTEMRHAIIRDFRRADLNDDSLLSEEEFVNGFSIILALRAAIRPDL